MKKTVLGKHLISFFIIIGLFTTFLLVFVFKTVRNFYTENLTENLQNINQSLLPTVSQFLKNGRFQELNNTVCFLGRKTGIRITIILPTGKVVADSETNPELMENHLTRLEIREALQGRPYHTIRPSNTLKEKMLYVSLPVRENGKILGAVRTSFWLKEAEDLLGQIQKKVVLFALVLLVISFLFSYASALGIARVIRDLKIGFQSLARGKFQVRIFPNYHGEFQELINGFNELAGQMQVLFDSYSRQTEELRSVINAIQENLGLFDKEGKLVLSNSNFNNLLTENDPRGRHYWELLRETAFASIIEEARKKKSGLTRELTLGPRTFLCSVAPVAEKEEIVVVLHDITDIKNLGRLKKNLVSNVSHELKTPLTAIKGYAETINCPDEENRHYVEVIKSHTERLINIVNDLITLAELEESPAPLQKEPVNLTLLTAEVIEIFKPRLVEKNLNFRLNADKDCLVYGDSFKLTQVITNLLDNAIRYTDKGEIEVEVKKSGEFVQVKVKDTGIGINPEHLDRIFERFYVVDKSRSRKTGGTGLGLAIVKHIVDLHKGKIAVQSTPGAGTEFTVTLPGFDNHFLQET